MTEPEVRRTDSVPDNGAPSRRSLALPYLVLMVWAFWWAQAVLIPIVCSVVFSYALEPFVSRLQRLHVPRAVAVPFVIGVAVASIGAGAYALRDEAAVFANGLPESARAAARSLKSVGSDRAGLVARAQQAAKELERAAGTTRAAGDPPVVRIEERPFKWEEWVWQGSRSALVFAAQVSVVLCLVYYLLASGDMFKRKLVRLVGPSLSHKKVTVEILTEIDRQIERFLIARAIISVVVGVAVWVTFRMLGLQQAGIWGVLAAVLFMIPVIGPFVLIGGAMLAALSQTGSLGTAAVAGAATSAIAAVEGNLLAPWLMGRLGAMNAVAVFVSLLFWGWLWGAWGLFLAVPITAAAKAVCERVEGLDAYAELLKA